MNTDIITLPSKSAEPEAELILAVYRRARCDLLCSNEQLREEAEAFFWREGFDPAAVRAAWAGRKRGGRPKGK